MQGPLKSLAPNARVGVVGGGISGLTFSYFLAKLRPDVHVTVFESKPRTGGWIRSLDTQDNEGSPIMLEQGPRTLRGVSDGTVLMADILKDLKRHSLLQYVRKRSRANKKFLLDTNDQLVQVPNSLMSALRFCFNPMGKGVLSGYLGERFRSKDSRPPGGDESVHSFISRRTGNELVSTNLVSAVCHGIYADDVKKLSARKVMGKFMDYEAQYGSIIKGSKKVNSQNKKSLSASGLTPLISLYRDAFSKDKYELARLIRDFSKYPMIGLSGGLETFTRSLTQELDKWPNVNLELQRQVQSVSKDPLSNRITVKTTEGPPVGDFDHLRITTNPSTWKETGLFNDQLSQKLLQRPQSNTVLLVNYYWPHEDLLLKNQQGFGYLVPQNRKNPEQLLGIIFDSVIEKNYNAYYPGFTKDMFTGLSKRQEYTKLTVMLGGHYLKERHTVPTAEETILAAKQALHNHLGISQQPLDNGTWKFVVAQDCLPHFFVGYSQWKHQVEQEVLNKFAGHISLGGMGFARGPGVPDVVTDSFMDVYKMVQDSKA
ncbi:hypothetical protein ZYGR_0N06480 [Zygosaccharomyces rouxii]|uniref:Protoporphyrinogen oxidase n=2 Tax=Zygosaccharomyces rouxii TaxID=4956 RepID=C5DWI8_ZYGRC|nr:uncharacterized protein ZYRO0D15202g [Zygosaccharomyces rouxii]KAH9201068.1 hypothetical protein LQ764DRAFT_227339 [Zygosaccharomyces rouxii]GAV49241.1 hypothetical protein ZYGR_0N06480 [Zygosaccharomyces rouxii]CAR28157.1 ZYRO0D15202p [Zygosaccharomyces rouxii]